MKVWTNEENYTAIGYLKFALEDYNEYHTDNDLPKLTEEQIKRIIGCMHYAFDTHTEEEALNKG